MAPGASRSRSPGPSPVPATTDALPGRAPRGPSADAVAFPRGRGGRGRSSRHAHALQRLLILGPAAAAAAGDRGAAVTPGARAHCSRMKDLNNPAAAPSFPTPNAHSHPLSSIPSAASSAVGCLQRPSPPPPPDRPSGLRPGAPYRTPGRQPCPTSPVRGAQRAPPTPNADGTCSLTPLSTLRDSGARRRWGGAASRDLCSVPGEPQKRPSPCPPRILSFPLVAELPGFWTRLQCVWQMFSPKVTAFF